MINYVNLGISEEEYEKEISPRLKEIFLSGQFLSNTPVEIFEKHFAQLCGTQYAIALNSGTDALIFALKSLGIGKGNEVITVSNSFIATANAITYVGATPVFVDINDNLLIDASKIKAAITPQTKAIIPVHLMGLVCDMDEILSIANEYALHVVEDAAQSVGSSYKGAKTGNLGTIGCFSLHPLKNLSGITDGGIITTNDAEIAQYIKEIRNHGLINRDTQNIVGTVSRLNSLNAVILDYRLTHLDSIIEKRRNLATIYTTYLKKIKGISLITYDASIYHTYHTYVIKVQYREALQCYLFEKGIETKIHYPVLIHRQKPYFKQGFVLENTEKLALQMLTLPIANVSVSDIEYICQTIASFYESCSW